MPLHAYSLSFPHPISSEIVSIQLNAFILSYLIHFFLFTYDMIEKLTFKIGPPKFWNLYFGDYIYNAANKLIG